MRALFESETLHFHFSNLIMNETLLIHKYHAHYQSEKRHSPVYPICMKLQWPSIYCNSMLIEMMHMNFEKLNRKLCTGLRLSMIFAPFHMSRLYLNNQLIDLRQCIRDFVILTLP